MPSRFEAFVGPPWTRAPKRPRTVHASGSMTEDESCPLVIVLSLMRRNSRFLTHLSSFHKMALRLETADRRRHGYMRSKLECLFCSACFPKQALAQTC